MRILSFSQFCDIIILISALCIAITNIYNFFAKPTSKLKKKKTEEQAVRYNITSEVSVKIYSRNKVYCELTTPLPQFGRTEVLSNELFNKRQSTQVLFNQQTGTLKKITDESIDK